MHQRINDCKISRPLTIMYWNADGIERDKLLLTVVLQTKQIDLALICETRLKINTNLKIRNYDIYHSPGPNPPYGGTAVIIKSCIPHHATQIPALQNLQLTAVNIKTSTEILCIGALYHSPSYELLDSDLNIMNNISQHFILAGDLNSKNTDWNSRITTKRGRKLARHAEENNYEILGPTEHTFFPHNSDHQSDVLDIVLKRSNSHILNLNTFPEFNSDHEPVIMEVDTNIQRTLLSPRTLLMTNWPLFRFKMNKVLPEQIQIKSKAELDEEITTLTNTIVAAKKEATSYFPIDENNKFVIPELETLLKYKRQIRRRYVRYRNPEDKTELNFLTKKVHTTIQNFRIQQLDNDVKEAISKNNIWPVIKRFKPKTKIRSNAIQGRYGIVFSPHEKAQAIADVLQHQFQPNPSCDTNDIRTFHREIRATVANFLKYKPETNINPATTSEIKQIIKQSNPKKAPGPDCITFETLRNLPHKCIKYIKNLFNSALDLNYFPLPWKISNIVTIPKPGKNPLLPENRRPISLINTLGKVYERIILKRMQEQALNIIPDHQFAFYPQRSTTLQLLRMVEYIQAGFNNQEHTTAVFLDVQKAFDSVWFTGLLHKLIHLGFSDKIVHLISSYLQNRSFHVKIDGAVSSRRKILAGVPQGSVLAPTLYNIYTSDLPEQHNSQIAQYADDTVLYYKHFSIINSSNNIRCHLQKMSQWCNKWRVKINESKSHSVIFTRRRPTVPPPLKLNNKTIDYNKGTKYLGIQLDNKLTWKNHIKYIRGKTLQRIYLLYPLLSSPVLSIKKKTELYKCLIRPIILYAAPVWGTTAKSNLNSLQVLQNKVARIITGADYYTRILLLYDVLDLTFLEDEIKNTAKTLYSGATDNPNPLISNLGKYQIHQQKYKMPASLTA